MEVLDGPERAESVKFIRRGFERRLAPTRATQQGEAKRTQEVLGRPAFETTGTEVRAGKGSIIRPNPALQSESSRQWLRLEDKKKLKLKLN